VIGRTKNYINYTLYALILAAIMGIVISSYGVWFVLPRGVGLHGYEKGQLCGYGFGGNPIVVWGWARYTWIEIHSWLGVAMASVILVHIVLHWRWIVETTRRIKSYFAGRMTRVKELYITAVVLFFLFAFEVLSGCVVWLIMPRGSYDYQAMVLGTGRTFWGLQRNVWVDLHGWVAVAIVAIIVIHLIMNWSWVVATAKNMARGIYGGFARLLAIKR